MLPRFKLWTQTFLHFRLFIEDRNSNDSLSGSSPDHVRFGIAANPPATFFLFAVRFREQRDQQRRRRRRRRLRQ